MSNSGNKPLQQWDEHPNNQQWQQAVRQNEGVRNQGQQTNQRGDQQKGFDGYLTSKAKEKKVNDSIIPENLNVERNVDNDNNKEEVKFEKGGLLEQPKGNVQELGGNFKHHQPQNVQPAGKDNVLPADQNNVQFEKQQVQQNAPVESNLDKQKDAYVQDNSFKSRKLNSVRIVELPSRDEELGGSLPWEKKGVFKNLIKVRKSFTFSYLFQFTQR